MLNKAKLLMTCRVHCFAEYKEWRIISLAFRFTGCPHCLGSEQRDLKSACINSICANNYEHDLTDKAHISPTPVIFEPDS